MGQSVGWIIGYFCPIGRLVNQLVGWLLKSGRVVDRLVGYFSQDVWSVGWLL